VQVGKDWWLQAQAADAGLPALVKLPSTRTCTLDVPFPLGIVWHWTSGVCTNPDYGLNLATSIQKYRKGIDVAASWTCLIGKDGRIYQSVPFNKGSWHVGRPGRIGGHLFGNINRGTVGVELENAGILRQVGGQFYCWPWVDSGTKKPDPKYLIDAGRARQQNGVWYDEFPPAQVASATRLLEALVAKLQWPRLECSYGHHQFDPTRRDDPGDLWLQVHLPGALDSVFGAG